MTTTLTTNETTRARVVLQPETLNMREDFRNSLNNRINNNISELISIENIDRISTIDSEIITEINNLTSSERRTELMRNVINQENIVNNSYFFIANSTNQVRTYLHDLLIRSALNMNIGEEDLYRVGNIFLYTIANLNEEWLSMRDIIQHLRQNMVIYNTDQIINILENHIPIYNDYLGSIRLATEEQLEGRIILNRQRIMYTGMGLVGSMALTSMSLPPVGGVIAKAVSSASTNSSSSSEIIRLRDIWDTSLKKLLDIIEK